MGNRRKPTAPPQPPPSECYVLGYVHPGEVSSYFLQSMLGTVLYDRVAKRRVAGILNEWSSANISNARNKIVRAFLEQAAGDWLMLVDADMAWDVVAPDQLMVIADPVNAPIVGGLCFGSTEDGLFPTIYHISQTEDGQPITMRLKDFPEDAMFQCAATGAAFLLIHRSVLVEMEARAFNPVFPWFQETEVAGFPCGEDITFCLRAGLMEKPVYVHTGVHIGHHKTHLLTHDKFRAQTPAGSLKEAVNVGS